MRNNDIISALQARLTQSIHIEWETREEYELLMEREERVKEIVREFTAKAKWLGPDHARNLAAQMYLDFLREIED